MTWRGIQLFGASPFFYHGPAYDNILNLATDYKKIQQLEDWDGYWFFTL